MAIYSNLTGTFKKIFSLGAKGQQAALREESGVLQGRDSGGSWENLVTATNNLIPEAGATRTLTATDKFMHLRCTNAAGMLMTLPCDATENLEIGFVCEIEQAGTGTVTYDDDSGNTTILSRNNDVTSANQYGSAYAKKVAADTWLLVGDLIEFDAPFDANAIHVNEAGEIAGITEKVTLHGEDMIVLEDPLESNNKRRATLDAVKTYAETIQLDNFAAPDDNTDLDASSTAHGLLPKLSDTPTEFLNGQGGWTTPPVATGFQTSGGGWQLVGQSANKGTVGTDAVDGSVSGAGLHGATGANSVCFGNGNLANTGYAGVLGGYSNDVLGAQSTICGGSSNTINGTWSVIGGGASNTTSNSYTTISGGYDNQVDNDYGVVGGGNNNTSTSTYSVVSGGQNNLATAAGSTVGGGASNHATANFATVSGGSSNTAGAERSCVSGGQSAVTRHHSANAHSSGRFSANGDAQLQRVPSMGASANTTRRVLYPSGATQNLVIQPNQAVGFIAYISCKTDQATPVQSAKYRIEGQITRDNANNTVLEWFSPTTVYEHADLAGCSVDAAADDTNEALQIRVTGIAATNIRWMCRLETEEVIY